MQAEKEIQKQITIIINGREKILPAKEQLSFEEITELAFPGMPTGPLITFTVTYYKGHGNKPEGSLVSGQVVKLKDGMVFNVTRNDKS